MSARTDASGHARPRRLRRAVARALAKRLASLAPLAALATTATAQDLRWNITPTAQQLTWNDALGLDNTLLWGGRAGLVFGRRIELQGFYLTNRGSDAGIRDLYDRLDITSPPPANRGLNLQNYGAALVYNFSVGGWTPFVRAGGSILRFDPDGGQVSERIGLSYGGGLRFGKPGGLRFNVFAENLMFRIDRRLLVGLPVAELPPIADADANRLRSNLTYGLGVTVPLGGGAVTYDDTPQYQLGNVALPVDVFAGRFDFANASGLPRQNVVGVRTGVDFGPLVGLRGFYFRGTNDNFNRTQGLQGYGGEAQFALNAGPGINPYLIAGAGQLDFLSGYTARPDAPSTLPSDQTALILGGGAKIPIGSRFVLNASARNWLTGVGGATEDVAERSQLRSNWQYALGFSFGIGGRGNRRRDVARRGADTVFVDSAGARLDRAAIARMRERMREEGDDSLALRPDIREALVVTADGDTLRGERADSALGLGRFARRARIDDRTARTRRDGGDTLRAGYASGRTVTVEVPTQGEIIVRYGPPAPPAPVMTPGMPMVGAAPQAQPERQLVREFADTRGRTVREFREPGDRLVQEYVDGGRTIREYRLPDNRLVREWPEQNRIVREYRTPGSSRVTREFLPLPVAPQPGGTMQPMQPMPANVAPMAQPQANVRTEVRKGAGAEPAPTGSEAAYSGAPLRVQEAQPAAPTQPAQPALTAEQIRAIVREEAERQRRANPPAPTVVTTPAPAVVETRTVESRPVPAPYFSNGIQTGLLYSGATINDGGQLLLGGRLDLGSISPNWAALHLVPELAFGFGNGGTSTYLAANAMYEFGQIARVRPRVSLGAGLLNFSSRVGSRSGLDVVVTPSYGVSIPFGRLRSVGTPELVVEHQGVSFFDLNRLIVALAWRR